MGAHVTAVRSTKNVDLVRSLGADVIVYYKLESVDTVLGESRRFSKILDPLFPLVPMPFHVEEDTSLHAGSEGRRFKGTCRDAGNEGDQERDWEKVDTA